jgi:hypothetical protein
LRQPPDSLINPKPNEAIYYSIFDCVGICAAQSLVQSVNSGSLIAAILPVSVGEIVVNPVNPTQASSGLIGILAYNWCHSKLQFAVTESIGSVSKSHFIDHFL